jgi:alpha-D-xyloside xylohydrolase
VLVRELVREQGMGWWTHDIGAIGGCNISDAGYRELLVRWFQFGVTSPIFRQHGSRPVEPWLLQPYEQRTYDAVVSMIKMRYELRPYVLQLMRALHETDAPVNRPLSFDFDADPAAWFVTDQFMFGPKYMSCPVTDAGMSSRTVYFPRGKACAGGWRHYFSGHVYPADGRTVTVAAPYAEWPFFECIP